MLVQSCGQVVKEQEKRTLEREKQLQRMRNDSGRMEA